MARSASTTTSFSRAVTSGWTRTATAFATVARCERSVPIRYKADTSGDGYTDGEKVSLGTDPLDYCAIMRADVNHDGTVTIADLSLVAGDFGSTTPPGDLRYEQNADNVITISDLSLQAGVFAQPVTSCP